MSKTQIIVIGLLLIGITLSACFKPDSFPNEPFIVSVTVEKTSMVQLEESLVISIDFEDGDGDLGYLPSDTLDNFFLVDSRTGFVDRYNIPSITPDGSVRSISGIVDLTIPSECCLPINPGGIPCSLIDTEYNPTDEVIFDVYVIDRAGNQSNIVQTPPITIICPQ